MAWSCLVIVLASAEYNEGAFGYGITTRAVVSTQAVGFVATHPVFATTIQSKPEVIATLIIVPILLLLAAEWLLPMLAQRFKRSRLAMPTLPENKKHDALLSDPVPMSVMLLIILTYVLLAFLRAGGRMR